MRTIFFATMVLVASLAGLAIADDQSAARAILDEAIKAHGGEAALGKIVGLQCKVKGDLYEGDKKVPASFDWCFEGTDKMRTVSFDEKNKIDEIEVVNGKDGWVKDDQQPTVNLSAEQVVSEHEIIYVSWATNFVPLKEREFRLSVLDETTVAGRKVVGILIAHDRHEPLKLYFDKESYLLAKYRRKFKNIESGKDVDEECLYSNYRTVQGTKQPFESETSWDGVKVSHFLISEIKLYDKPLDEKLFSKP